MGRILQLWDKNKREKNPNLPRLTPKLSLGFLCCKHWFVFIFPGRKIDSNLAVTMGTFLVPGISF